MNDLRKHLTKRRDLILEDTKKIRLEELEAEHSKLRSKLSQLDWQKNRAEAESISKKEANLAEQIKRWRGLLEMINDAVLLAEDPKLRGEIETQAGKIDEEHETLRKILQFKGPYDNRDVIIGIHAGAGGTDAQDWAQMLLRMYVRWAEKNGLRIKTIDQTLGEEAGIKSVTVELADGNFLFGRLSGEHGVHRLVRLSPFNADHLRQTSFAKVEVLPLIDKPEDVEVDDKDLKIDVFRSGGPGGQSVNTTDSAVRIMHMPTGITVSVQNERSQQQNKQTALAILRSKLVQLQLEQHKEHLSELKGPNQSAEWGNQIRSYVLHPYKQVKDLRSGYESSDVQRVLDGGLEPLIDAWLERKTTD
jgi:peptide chain release factor 2